MLAISTEAKPHANPIDTVDVICYDLQLNTDFIDWSVIAADGSLGKTFYATHDGEYFTSFYFLTSGTVTIGKKDGKLCFEINALNSYDVPVHIIYEASTTAVENISKEKINSQKKIEDGQLMIIRNGKTYNAFGTQVE